MCPQDTDRPIPRPDHSCSSVLVFFTLSLSASCQSQSGWGCVYIDRTGVLEMRSLARHVAPHDAMMRLGEVGPVTVENPPHLDGRAKN